ncbi:MAG TPA: hypothetical protein VFH17_05070 [Coriobacteriia bacterium]|nr:hypothetical protein [Coriobacteriia bacterium]
MKAAAFIVLAWVVFGVLGELAAAFGIWTFAPESPSLYAALVAIGYLAALACVAVAILVRRSGCRPSAFIRFALAGFAAFFCLHLIVFGLPDWSPLPLLGGVAWCWACGVSVLWLTGAPRGTLDTGPAAA